jgi:hypothetical protein
MSNVIQYIKRTIRACYLWEMALNVDLKALFNNMCGWKVVPGKAGRVNTSEPYTYI